MGSGDQRGEVNTYLFWIAVDVLSTGSAAFQIVVDGFSAYVVRSAELDVVVRQIVRYACSVSAQSTEILGEQWNVEAYEVITSPSV